MLRLLETRHGETLYNVDNLIQGGIDVGLTDNGEEQAEMLAEHLRDTTIDYVITGTLERQVKTGEKVAVPRGITIVKDPRLNERSWGRYDGKPCDKVDTGGIPLSPYLFLMKDPNDDSNPDIEKDPDNPGETIEAVMKRVAAPYDELVAQYSKSPLVTTVLWVSSQFANSYLLNHIVGNKSKNLRFYHQENMCINEVRVTPIVTEIIHTNFMEHVHWRRQIKGN